MKPKTLIELENKISKLPGISKKQAEKIAIFLVKQDSFFNEELVSNIIALKEKIKPCSNCGIDTEKNMCNICLDKKRRKTLIIVENSIDVYKFENLKLIEPYYHVLNGLVNVAKQNEFEDLNIKNLKTRAQEFNEVIIALSSSLDGLITTEMVKKLLGNQVKITQLAQGIPLGAEMEYVDSVTLKSAFINRKESK